MYSPSPINTSSLSEGCFKGTLFFFLFNRLANAPAILVETVLAVPSFDARYETSAEVRADGNTEVSKDYINEVWPDGITKVWL